MDWNFRVPEHRSARLELRGHRQIVLFPMLLPPAALQHHASLKYHLLQRHVPMYYLKQTFRYPGDRQELQLR